MSSIIFIFALGMLICFSLYHLMCAIGLYFEDPKKKVVFHQANFINPFPLFKTIWIPTKYKKTTLLHHTHMDDILLESVIIHEEVHLRQQINYGSDILWLLRYKIDQRFKKKQEIEAFLEEYTYLKKMGFIIPRNNIIKAAKEIADTYYGVIKEKDLIEIFENIYGSA